MSFDTEVFEKQQAVPEKPTGAEIAWVRCSGYRCMAFRDKAGIWRDYFRGEPLPEPVEILQVI